MQAFRVDALVMRQLKIDGFKMIVLNKLEALSHNTSIIPLSHNSSLYSTFAV